MAHINGSKAEITVYATKLPVWTDKVLSHLTGLGYNLDWVKNMTQCRKKQKQNSLDVIITVSAKDSTNIARLLHKEAPRQRPLHIFITDDEQIDFPDKLADMILPSSPQFVEQQLQLIIGMRREIGGLREEVHFLKDEITEMTGAMDKQRHLLNEVEVLKNAIVRNVSHELKTPLLHVKSAVALIAEDVEDEKLVSYAKNATGRLETLVKNITLLSSGLDTNLGPVIVREAAEYAKRNLGRIWESRGDVSRVKLKFKKNLPPVMADKQGLSTILQLLIDNALKFSEDDILVWAKRSGEQLVISVEDHGIGIEEEQLDTIFDTFYQVDGSPTRRYGGSGIGLAIVRLILEHHDTQINVNSKVNEGSVFSFKLPLVKL